LSSDEFILKMNQGKEYTVQKQSTKGTDKYIYQLLQKVAESKVFHF